MKEGFQRDFYDRKETRGLIVVLILIGGFITLILLSMFGITNESDASNIKCYTSEIKVGVNSHFTDATPI